MFISKTSDRRKRQLAYAANPDARKRNISVQYLNFLEDSIRERTWGIPKERLKGMSGRVYVYVPSQNFFSPPSFKLLTFRGREGRTEYTQEDDENLARYFAAILPDRASGGRTGNNPYKHLCELVRSLLSQGETVIDSLPWAGGNRRGLCMG